ncbi:MAG: hypothetical protein C5B53_09995 [Candidatus Melainabacteria bacterium]|nr:MAG: hypothetical protein C5B53_09995 [Candidatus Melainabacteria bacterium]
MMFGSKFPDRILVFLVFVLLGSLSLFVSCGTSSDLEGLRQESVYDRVIRTGKIRCAYVICPPACIKDPNSGKLSGAAIEAIQMVGKKLGLLVEFPEEVGWSTALEGLETNRYDLIATPLWTNADRAKIVGFSNPLCYNPVYAYVKKGQTRFNSVAAINSPDVRIATIDGDTSQVIAESDFPKAKRLAMVQSTDYASLMLNVATKKADVTFADPVGAFFFQKSNPDSIEVLDKQHPVRVFPTCWVFRRDQFEFKAMIDTVLDEVINSGTMDRLIDKYLPAPNLLYKVALPYQVPSSLSASKDGATVVR